MKKQEKREKSYTFVTIAPHPLECRFLAVSIQFSGGRSEYKRDVQVRGNKGEGVGGKTNTTFIVGLRAKESVESGVPLGLKIED